MRFFSKRKAAACLAAFVVVTGAGVVEATFANAMLAPDGGGSVAVGFVYYGCSDTSASSARSTMDNGDYAPGHAAYGPRYYNCGQLRATAGYSTARNAYLVQQRAAKAQAAVAAAATDAAAKAIAQKAAAANRCTAVNSLSYTGRATWDGKSTLYVCNNSYWAPIYKNGVVVNRMKTTKSWFTCKSGSSLKTLGDTSSTWGYMPSGYITQKDYSNIPAC